MGCGAGALDGWPLNGFVPCKEPEYGLGCHGGVMGGGLEGCPLNGRGRVVGRCVDLMEMGACIAPFCRSVLRLGWDGFVVCGL